MKHLLLALIATTAIAQPPNNPHDAAIQTFADVMQFYKHPTDGYVIFDGRILYNSICFEGKDECSQISVYPDGKIDLKNISLEDAFLTVVANQARNEIDRAKYEDEQRQTHPRKCHYKTTKSGVTVICFYSNSKDKK